MKKAAALLITLLLVSSLGLLTLVMLRSSIMKLIANQRASDAIIAEEASRGGLEYGLLQCQLATTDKAIPLTPDYSRDLSSSPNQHVDVYWGVSGTSAVPPVKGCSIVAIGSAANTSFKKHMINVGVGFVAGDCHDTTNYCAARGLNCGTISGTDACNNPYSQNCGTCSGTCSGNICTPATHLVCSGMTCTSVDGAGANQCSTNSDCSHLACSGATCTTVAGSGANQCSTNSDCSHLACVSNACVTVAGAGANSCTTNSDCVACRNSGFCTSDSQCCTAQGYFCGAYACIGLGNPEMCSQYTYPPSDQQKVCRKQVCTGPGDCTRGVGQSCLDPEGQIYDALCQSGLGCASQDTNGNYGKCCARSGSSFACSSTSQCCPGSTCNSITHRCN